MSLYKYVTPERVDVLSGGRIRFTQAAALNDPFELAPQFKSLATRAEIEERVGRLVNIERALEVEYGRLPRKSRRALSLDEFKARALEELDRQGGIGPLVSNRVSEFVDNDLPGLSAMALRQLKETLATRVGILSLSATATNTLMWAHYSDDHKGFAIEFDESNSFFNSKRSEADEFFHVRPVSYSDQEACVELITDLDGTKILCIKGSEWAYEQESRMLIPLDGISPRSANGDLIYLVGFPMEAIRTIIFGAKASKDLKASIRKVVSKNPGASHIAFRHIALDFSTRSVSIYPDTESNQVLE